jgi:hypothetical protein
MIIFSYIDILINILHHEEKLDFKDSDFIIS